jgi:hypothetical protein
LGVLGTWGGGGGGGESWEELGTSTCYHITGLLEGARERVDKGQKRREGDII